MSFIKQRVRTTKHFLCLHILVWLTNAIFAESQIINIELAGAPPLNCKFDIQFTVYSTSRIISILCLFTGPLYSHQLVRAPMTHACKPDRIVEVIIYTVYSIPVEMYT